MRLISKSNLIRALACFALSGATAAYLACHGAGTKKVVVSSALLLIGFLAIWLAERRFCGPEKPPAPKRPDFDWGMHYMRGFAIVCIMLTHFFGRTGSAKFAHAFLTSSTIFFLFISGYLCQYLAFRRPVKTGMYYRSKLKNVVSPYVVCSFATMAAVWLLQAKRVGVVAPASISVRNIPNILLLGWAQRQYWYIPFVILLFLVSPWLTRVRHHTLVWLSVVSFSAALCFPWRPPSHLTWDLSRLLYRLAYFSWGYLFGFAYARWKDEIDPHLHAYVAPALFFGLVLGLFPLVSAGTVWMPTHVLSGSFAWTLQKLFFLVPVLWIANRIRSIRIAPFDWLATYSFTLFFLHYFFIKDYILLQSSIFTAINPSPLLRACVHLGLAALFVAQNLLLAVLLKKATGRWSRSFVGA